MTRICNREGCTRHVFARAKCVSHYNSYIKSLRRKGSTLHAAVDTWTEVQKAMPGTLNQLAQRTEIAYNTVRKTVSAKHKAGEAHIVSHLPPEESGGARWVRVFAAGAGKDHVVPPKEKADHALETRRLAHAARKSGAKAAPKIVTCWNLAFFNPAQAYVGVRA